MIQFQDKGPLVPYRDGYLRLVQYDNKIYIVCYDSDKQLYGAGWLIRINDNGTFSRCAGVWCKDTVMIDSDNEDKIMRAL